MKTLKTLLSVFAIAAVFSTGAMAQETAEVPVTANVEAALSLTPTAIALGTIQQATSTIDANTNDTATETNLGAGASAGSLQIVGSAGVDVSVSWTNATLDNADNTDPITFTPSVYNGSSSVSSGGTVTLPGPDLSGTVTLNGDITLDVGGTLASPSGTGSYSTANGSAITFTVQYN
ncbi:hypothetical protein [Gracilimonas halophila]|uniref:DUF4402 domain-containing protein n=1 Tax=Gracilimonas halophila TaxID=1834464 RepID=A0ABW5JM44_9BACT